MPEDDQPFRDLDPATIAVRDLIAASRELVGRMSHVMGMNPTDMSAIGALSQGGPMGVAELARHLGIRSASASAMVDRLERAGHVERVRDLVDRRRVTVTETAVAREATNQAWEPVVMAIDRACRALDEQERAVVRRLLAQVTEVVTAGGVEAGSDPGPAPEPAPD